MTNPATELWEQIRLSDPQDERIWELFHENSKTHRFSEALDDAAVAATMLRLWEDLPYPGTESVTLPDEDMPPVSLVEAIHARRTPLKFEPGPLTLSQLSSLLITGYGSTTRESAVGQRIFRTVPSAGALYPLELYVFASDVTDLASGLYHFRGSERCLQRLKVVAIDDLAPMFVQPDLIESSAAVVFLTAVFGRSTFKYGERGYRFALIEAGHVAQNLSLIATALGAGSANLGGFFDREIENFLGIDGVEHSILYATAFGLVDVPE